MFDTFDKFQLGFTKPQIGELTKQKPEMKAALYVRRYGIYLLTAVLHMEVRERREEREETVAGGQIKR